MSWFDSAVEHIREATKDLPIDTPLQERMKIVDAAYPFGERSMFPYKMWLKARRQYLGKFGYRNDLPLLSPLELQKKRADGRAANHRG